MEEETTSTLHSVGEAAACAANETMGKFSSKFLDFVKTANSLDDKRFSDCQDRASRYNAAYRKYRAETSAHSLKFDQPGWNQGNQYSRHPLNTSMFKWE